jgi:hypothetical protein
MCCTTTGLGYERPPSDESIPGCPALFFSEIEIAPKLLDLLRSCGCGSKTRNSLEHSASGNIFSGKICALLLRLSLSNADLKSSRIMLSVKHLKTNANFQNGLMTPIGITGVTERRSMMIQMRLRHMQRSRTAKRGEAWMISMKPRS